MAQRTRSFASHSAYTRYGQFVNLDIRVSGYDISAMDVVLCVHAPVYDKTFETDNSVDGDLTIADNAVTGTLHKSTVGTGPNPYLDILPGRHKYFIEFREGPNPIFSVQGDWHVYDEMGDISLVGTVSSEVTVLGPDSQPIQIFVTSHLSAPIDGGFYGMALGEWVEGYSKEDIDAHTTDFINPHNVTFTQVNAYATWQVDALVGGVETDLATHEALSDNPHSVTAGQVGADALGSASAVQTNLDIHEADAGNPHAVTATQAGAYTQAQVDSIIAGLQSQIDTLTGRVTAEEAKLPYVWVDETDVAGPVVIGTGQLVELAAVTLSEQARGGHMWIDSEFDVDGNATRELTLTLYVDGVLAPGSDSTVVISREGAQMSAYMAFPGSQAAGAIVSVRGEFLDGTSSGTASNITLSIDAVNYA